MSELPFFPPITLSDFIKEYTHVTDKPPHPPSALAAIMRASEKTALATPTIHSEERPAKAFFRRVSLEEEQKRLRDIHAEREGDTRHLRVKAPDPSEEELHTAFKHADAVRPMRIGDTVAFAKRLEAAHMRTLTDHASGILNPDYAYVPALDARVRGYTYDSADVVKLDDAPEGYHTETDEDGFPWTVADKTYLLRSDTKAGLWARAYLAHYRYLLADHAEPEIASDAAAVFADDMLQKIDTRGLFS